MESWAVILGGSSGLGLATAKKLAGSGRHICVVHRTRKSELAALEDNLEDLRKCGVEVKSFNMNALLKETMDTVIESLPDGKVDVLIHSIAKGSLKPLSDKGHGALSKEDISITLEAMGYSWYEWTRNLLQEGKFASHVSNIAFTSEGNSKVWPGYGAISAAKAVLESLMRSMAVEYAEYGIRTNCIQAGATRTASFEMIPGSDQLAAMAEKRNPFKRMTTPEDVADAVYLLCRKEAAWINGTVIKVDGGESLR